MSLGFFYNLIRAARILVEYKERMLYQPDCFPHVTLQAIYALDERFGNKTRPEGKGTLT